MMSLKSPRNPARPGSRHVTVAALILMLVMAGSVSHAAEHPVGLGTATDFAVLAGSTITNTGSTTIVGNIGLHPGTAVTGYRLVTHTGTLHVDDGVAEQAKADLVTAYNDAAGRDTTADLGTELGGQTLTAGVYDSASGTFGITGTLALDAQGNPDAVFIFQTASTLVTASNSGVLLINGADPCNVFWQVGSSATLGTSTSFVGTIMALESITLNTGAVIDGRALARNSAVTMDTNTISQAACTTPPGDTPPDDTPPDDTPPDDTPPDDTPTDDTPTDDTPTDDTPTDDTPDAVNTPAMNAPAVDAPAVDAPEVDSPTESAPPMAAAPPVGNPPDTPPEDSPPGTSPPGNTPPNTPPAAAPPDASTPRVPVAPPIGGVPAGGGSTAAVQHPAGVQDTTLLAMGFALLLSAVGIVAIRPRRVGKHAASPGTRT